MTPVRFVDPNREGIERALVYAFNTPIKCERVFDDLLTKLDHKPERQLERVR